jgi:hypothetical protein
MNSAFSTRARPSNQVCYLGNLDYPSTETPPIPASLQADFDLPISYIPTVRARRMARPRESRP